MMSFDVDDFVARQLEVWPMACANYEALKSVERKDFCIDGYHIAVQFNPARKVSTGANMSSKAIAERPCFLCEKNRPKEQFAFDVDDDFSILVNPFPIFPKHLTIVLKRHEPQSVYPYLDNMRRCARMMPQMVVFFNGAHSGASAPDHLHFQASEASCWPMLGDYERGQKRAVAVCDGAEVDMCDNIGRLVYRVRTESNEALEQAIKGILELHDRKDDMVNVMMHGEDVYVVPRKLFRPWQYSAEDDRQLMVSPASVEVGGVFITPVEEHFRKICECDIKSIFEQVCF
ncbi:MAG: DUF4922 domain-containing protein [Bacteroidales bacterium]|nr:DUF4922 domain-containing protein [Bacteroidales bacterium]